MSVEAESMDAEPEPETKTRNCLMCTHPFSSTWVGERVCSKCKSTSTWKSG